MSHCEEWIDGQSWDKISTKERRWDETAFDVKQGRSHGEQRVPKNTDWSVRLAVRLTTVSRQTLFQPISLPLCGVIALVCWIGNKRPGGGGVIYRRAQESTEQLSRTVRRRNQANWPLIHKKLIAEIGRKITEHTGERRATEFLRQRISIEIERGNTVSVSTTYQGDHPFYEVFNFLRTKH